MVSAGPYARQYPTTQLQVGCPSCYPTNSVKALKALAEHRLVYKYFVYTCSRPLAGVCGQDAIDRVKTLQSEGRLSGVIDDRGKFICITPDEYETVARFIRQRGRVSISELADSMNRLIRLKAADPLTTDTDVTATA